MTIKAEQYRTFPKSFGGYDTDFIHIHILESYLPDYIPIRLGTESGTWKNIPMNIWQMENLGDVYHHVDNAYRVNHLLYSTLTMPAGCF